MPPELKPDVTTPRDFSVSRDPFAPIAQRLRLARDGGKLRASWLVAITWLPLCVGALLRVIVEGRPAPILYDISVHTRLLIAIPLLVLAERVLEDRCRSCVTQLYNGAFCERDVLERIVDRAERLRDSRLAELVILAGALFAGQAALWGLIGSTGLVSGVEDAGGLSFARLWYASVGLPTVLFLGARWLWHWLIWSYVVIHLSRQELATIATHPDHAGGIGFLDNPLTAVWLFVLAVSAMMASAWGTHMIAGRAALAAFVPTFVAFMLVAGLLAVGPLVLFIGIMYRTRYRATRPYRGFALRYVRAFHDKWIAGHAPTGELLGTADIQALNDLGGAFESLLRIRLVPFSVRALAGVWLAAIIPVVPLVISTMPVEELLRSIGDKMVGGLL